MPLNIRNNKLQSNKLARIAGLFLVLVAFQVQSEPTPTVNYSPTEYSLLTVPQLPDFQNLNIDDFTPAMVAAMQAYNDKLSSVLQQPISWQNTILPLAAEMNRIKSIWNLLNIVSHSSNTLAASVYEFHNKVMHNKELYRAFLAVKANVDFNKLTPAQQLYINQSILAFKQYGADLTPAQLQRYDEIVQRLGYLANQFTANLDTATAAWQYHITPQEKKRLEGLPDVTKKNAAAKAAELGKRGWVLTLDDSCLIAVMSFSKNIELRKTMYTAYTSLATDNDKIVTETLALRQELASLIGYPNYAAYTLADRQPPDAAQVMQFLQDIAGKLKPQAQKELANLQSFATKKDQVRQLLPWDIAYYAEALKFDLYSVNEDATREYISQQKTITGIFNLTSIIFGVQFQEVKDASTWNSDVKLYLITDTSNNKLGYFYVDLFARPNKQAGISTKTYVPRFNYENGTMLLPTSVISTNFSTDNKNTLTHDDIVVFCNQFGIMLENTLAMQDYPAIAGTTGVTVDAVELSSQFMQNWAWQPQAIKDITKLPDAIFNNLLAARNFDAALDLLRQLEFAMFDLRLHLNLATDKGKKPQEILNEIRQQYGVLPTLPQDQYANRFVNIFGYQYAASYYQPYWAQMLASDAIAAFAENGVFSSKIGHKYYTEILQKGGTASTLDLFIKFRGREPDSKYLLQQLGL
jgi:oligopeptidase A